MRQARAITVRWSGLMLAACLCMVVLGFLHSHDLDGSEQPSDSHFCFACSVASAVDVETGQSLPRAEESPVQLTAHLVAPDPLAPPLVSFAARAPPRFPS